ncbi:MAG TPA: hypothetical protein VN626_00945 [Clostridia bacterium]|nr:hypothetical protein [Clostridia bacterium]
MAAFGSVMNMVRDVANIATKKTGTAVELSKLKLQMMQLRSQIQSTYERIGILIYEQEKTGTDNYELVSVCIKEIDSLLVHVNEINANIAAIKDGVKCPNCNTTNPVNTTYCKSCGVNLNKNRE